MKNFVALTTAVLLTFSGSSCAALKEKNPSDKEPVKLRDFSSEDETAAFNTAEKFVLAFAEALKKNDFSLWQQVIPPDSTAKIGKKQFDAMRLELGKEFGTFSGTSYLGKLVSGHLRSFMWKFSFIRQKNGKSSIREIVYFVRIFCEEGKTPAISGFGVRVF